MFIKKDLRKIPKILEDSKIVDEEDKTQNDDATRSVKRLRRPEPLQDLRLSRRQQEFQGSIQLLCQPKNLPTLKHLQFLNLYDCAISNLNGIGLLEDCPLQVLNLGRNPLSSLPDEIARLKSLKDLWMEDCHLEGPLPNCLLQLVQLESLRVANNQITTIPKMISQLRNLQLLCLDRNLLTELPNELANLSNLHSLFLRHNQLSTLPENLFLSLPLQVLHVSSNRLIRLPNSMSKCTTLTHVYANSNHLKSLPIGLETLPNLKRMVFSHNNIDSLSTDFMAQWGTTALHSVTGICQNDHCTILLNHNPVVTHDDEGKGDHTTDVDVDVTMSTPIVAA